MPQVLVTGGEGFLGSHVCELFTAKGWQVTSLDNRTRFELMRTGYNVEKARDFNTKYLEKLGVALVVGDIRDKYALSKAAKGADYIINCAAQPAMTIALETPCYDADVNIMGTLNVLVEARKLGVPAAICSTIHVYGNDDNEVLESLLEMPHRYSEDECLLGGSITPLHVSKYCTELYARAFTESFDLPVFTARLTGIYGPRQLGGEDHGWVANFAIRTLLGLPIKVFGTDKQVRDILYVTDAAQAFFDWYQKPVSGVYNIGGGVPCITSLGQCLKMLREITGREQSITLEPARKGDLWYFCCDISKAKSAFGWSPKVLPKRGIQELVDWINENKELFTK